MKPQFAQGAGCVQSLSIGARLHEGFSEKGSCVRFSRPQEINESAQHLRRVLYQTLDVTCCDLSFGSLPIGIRYRKDGKKDDKRC